MSFTNYMTISNDTDVNYNNNASKTIKRRYFGKKSNNIILDNNGKYIPDKKDCKKILDGDKTTDISKEAYLSISCKCNKLLEEKLPTIMNRSSDDYKKYMESEIYKKSSENMKDANAYLWYYSTNRFNNDNYLKHVKHDLVSDMSNNINIKKQMDYLAANIIANNFITFGDTSGNNKIIDFSLSKLPSNIIRLISLIFFIYSSISFLVTIYNFLGFGNIQVNLFYTPYNKKYYILSIIIFFIIILLCIAGINYNPINLLFNITGTEKVDKNSVIFEVPNKLPKINEKFTQNVNEEHFTISRKKCIITKDKKLKCDCDSDDCKNTRFGCCPNGKDPKLDASGINCSTINNYPGYIFLCILVGLIFGISYLSLNITNRKYISIILFIICVLCVLFIIFILFNYIDVITTGVDIIKTDNTCNNVMKYKSNNRVSDYLFSVGVYCGSLFVLLLFGCAYLGLKKNIFRIQKKNPNPFSIIVIILCSLIVFFASITMIFFNFILAFGESQQSDAYISSSILYLIIMVAIRFFWIGIAKIITVVINKNNKNNKNINYLSTLYHTPIEYMYRIFKNRDKINNTDKIFNILKPNFYENEKVTGNLAQIEDNKIVSNKSHDKKDILEYIEIPTGMPWDMPGIKIFKSITFLVYLALLKIKTPIENKSSDIKKLRFGMNYIPNLTNKKDEYFGSNSQVFTSPFNIIFYIMNLF